MRHAGTRLYAQQLAISPTTYCGTCGIPFVNLCISAVPAGEIARHALPGQGAREQSAGVTLAGRVPTTTEGGGGGAPWRGGGGGVEEGGAT